MTLRSCSKKRGDATLGLRTIFHRQVGRDEREVGAIGFTVVPRDVSLPRLGIDTEEQPKTSIPANAPRTATRADISISPVDTQEAVKVPYSSSARLATALAHATSTGRSRRVEATGVLLAGSRALHSRSARVLLGYIGASLLFAFILPSTVKTAQPDEVRMEQRYFLGARTHRFSCLLDCYAAATLMTGAGAAVKLPLRATIR